MRVTLLLLAYTILVGIVTSLSQKVQKRQTEDFNAGGLPSHLPSPPEPPATEGQQPSNLEVNDFNNMGGMGNNNLELNLTEIDQSGGEGNATEEEDDSATKEEDNSGAPFGFDETILIIVPQFKFTIHGFPEWAGASVRLSLPITMFFDEMEWPKFPLSMMTGLGYILNRRWDRDRFRKIRRNRSILSLPPPDYLRGGERATVIPTMEAFLTRFGIKGKHCLLRTICEVHEAQVDLSYGFLGHFITQMFSISRSQYAESHMASYLAAENSGKQGNCSQYYRKCLSSIFEQ